MRFFSFSLLFVMACFVSVTFCEDYYDILGVGKDADSREIRKAFKKLALTEHPDKNKAEGAQENFLKISKAYETLKDEEKRKRYDRFGEEDDEQQQQQRQRGYQSWNYYHDDFGLYDDDPEIITLDYNDFRRSVKDAYSFWFINYYSPQCSHCHDLAPTWRRLAHKLEGIVRIGAVNCQDDFMLCRQQNIRGYPSLIFYNPNGASSKFNGAKEEEYLMEFIVKNLPEYWFSMRKENYEHVTQKTDRGQMPDSPWIIFFCSSNSFQCPEQTERKLLAHTLNGIVNVGLVDCDNDESFCNKKTGDDLGVYFFHTAKDTLKPNLAHKLAAAENIKETRKEVLDLLPDVPLLDDEKYSKVRIKLEDDIGPGWLIHFVFGKDGDHRDEKTIQPKIGKIKFGKVDCFKCPEACKEMFIKKPQYVMFKVGGGFEFHYGREEPSDVIEFARVSNQAVTMTTLSDSDFPDIISSNGVFIDFFAPWCPPCLNLLPEFRKASINVGGSIIFGTVDCTVYGSICNQYNIRSYPTTVFFNMSKPHFYHGHHTADGLSEFVMEILRPSVMNLNYAEFQNLVGRKPENEMWLVDFFAPWCGPCMQLAPEWTRMAKLLEKRPEVHVAKVDCVAEPELCRDQAVRSYPTLRMYPIGSNGIGRYFVYNGYQRDGESLRDWAAEYLPEVVEGLTPYTFKQKVAGSDRPAIIKFYTPWCGHCQRFAPAYEEVGVILQSDVLVGKINCERFQKLCGQLNIRAYPTIKFYAGLTDQGTEISDRDPIRLIEFVRKLMKTHSRHDEL